VWIFCLTEILSLSTFRNAPDRASARHSSERKEVLEGVCKVIPGRLRRALSKNALCPIKSLTKQNEVHFTHMLLAKDSIFQVKVFVDGDNCSIEHISGR
jgi:hypothetical protein